VAETNTLAYFAGASKTTKKSISLTLTPSADFINVFTPVTYEHGKISYLVFKTLHGNWLIGYGRHHRDCSVHIVRANKHCEGVACTRLRC
jgi:hypothetical protein